MLRTKHNQKMNHVVIVSSDKTDGDTKQYMINARALSVIVFIVCLLVGGVIGYLCYEDQFWDAMNQRNMELQEEIRILEDEKKALEVLKQTADQKRLQAEARVVELEEQILILSETVNEKKKMEEELRAQLDGQSIPTEFPLTGSATMTIGEGDTPICLFTASEGNTVVATASGTVTAVNNEETYGHNVWIDHGNGYVTVYRNKGDVTVKPGDSVVRGSTLFLIGEDNTELGYQMQKDGSYIDPTEMMAISG